MPQLINNLKNIYSMNEDNKGVPVPNFEGEKMKMPENTDLPPEETKSKSVINGPVLGMLTLLLILILGGMYYWFFTINKSPEIIPPSDRPTAEENNEPESNTAEAQVKINDVSGSSDEIGTLEADLDSTIIDTNITDLDIIDNEIEANTAN